MALVARRLPAPIFVALGATFLTWLTSFLSPTQTLEGRTVDWRFLFRGPLSQRSLDIVLVLIEEEADLPYRSPIPRQHLAEIINHLTEARLVGLDILLDKPSFDKDGDELLLKVLEAANNVVAVS